MKKSEIIAELRRSACEDERPWRGCKSEAFAAACKARVSSDGSLIYNLTDDDLRTFYLLVSSFATAPDFEALRARRNEAVQEQLQEIADDLGVPLQSLGSTFNPHSCYCACGTGGPCEHKWDGEAWESEDGRAWSTTCSRCGTTAMSHDMRNGP